MSLFHDSCAFRNFQTASGDAASHSVAAGSRASQAINSGLNLGDSLVNGADMEKSEVGECQGALDSPFATLMYIQGTAITDIDRRLTTFVSAHHVW
jgi:hypothetical protein